MPKETLTYTGTIQPESGTYYEPIQQKIYPYTVDPDGDLVEMVNLAIELGMPLLLEGEPGCGKSRLAHALVYELNDRKKNYPIKYYSWTVQSTSKAEDSLYQYDYLGRLQAAQIGKAIQEVCGETGEIEKLVPVDSDKTSEELEKETKAQDSKNSQLGKLKKPINPNDWVNLQALGKAIQKSQDEKQRSVVLIDEIDKADRDFPNDLLEIIESGRFLIQETGETIKADENNLPIILITSNQEKNLPNAFLRRCIYHYIEFPSQERLIEILTKRFTKAEEDIIIEAVARFMKVREAQEGKPQWEKKVSTSELIFWFQSLLRYKPEEIKAKLKQKKLPHAGVLLKSREDLLNYEF